MTWNWQAALVFLAVWIAVSVVGKFLVFKVPAFAVMRAANDAADKQKLARKPYRAAIKRNNMAGLVTNAVFVVLVLPFCVGLESRPLWRHAVDMVAVLMIYDLLYYLMHRFLFHGRWLRRVHALHHQARTPTYIDALYVHPIETVMGLGLFLAMWPMWAIVTGGPLHAVSMALTMVVFTYLNQINHTWEHLPRMPYRVIDSIAALHAAHHVDMNRGNYATITLLYDWLFGTYEQPVRRATP